MYAVGTVVVKMKNLDEEWRLWPLGDIHLGNVGCDETQFDKTISCIANDDHAMWIGMGDYADLIGTDDKRFDPEGVAQKFQSAYFKKFGPTMRNELLKRFVPIADKCIGILMGNHEFSYEQRFDQAMASALCEGMNDSLEKAGSAHRVPYMGYCGFRDIAFTKGKQTKTFRICAHHGAGWAATKGGKLNRLLQFMRQFDADIFLMGHVHNITEDVLVCIGADEACEHLIHRTKVGVETGAYLRAYPEGGSNYAERKMYEPSPLGSPCVVIKPGDGKLSVEKPW